MIDIFGLNTVYMKCFATKIFSNKVLVVLVWFVTIIFYLLFIYYNLYLFNGNLRIKYLSAKIISNILCRPLSLPTYSVFLFIFNPIRRFTVLIKYSDYHLSCSLFFVNRTISYTYTKSSIFFFS